MVQGKHDSVSRVGLWLVPGERSVCVCLGVGQDQEGIGGMEFFAFLS